MILNRALNRWILGWALQGGIGLFLLWHHLGNVSYQGAKNISLLVVLSALWIFGLMAAAYDVATGKLPAWLGGLILCLTSLAGYWGQHEGQLGTLLFLAKKDLSNPPQILLLGSLLGVVEIPLFLKKRLLAPFDALWIGACLLCLPLETGPLFLGLTGVLLFIIGFGLWGKTLRGQKLPMIPAILLSLWFCLVN